MWISCRFVISLIYRKDGDVQWDRVVCLEGFSNTLIAAVICCRISRWSDHFWDAQFLYEVISLLS